MKDHADGQQVSLKAEHAFYESDFRKSNDGRQRLQQFTFESKLTWFQPPEPVLAQILKIVNIGVANKQTGDDFKGGECGDDEDDCEGAREPSQEKFESKYLEASDAAKNGKGRSKEVNRALKYLITDGLVECIMFELDRLTGLGMDTVPGTKVLLFGTIDVRWGIYMVHHEQLSLIHNANPVEHLGTCTFLSANQAILNPG